MTGFSESVVEQAALPRLEGDGRQIRNGADITPSDLRVRKAASAITG